MKIPPTPPSLDTLLKKVKGDEMKLVFQNPSPLPAGRYLHWQELLRRPPPEGLSHEGWWASVWMGRNALMQSLPLLDKRGVAFNFATPSLVQINLHHIDKDAAGQINTTIGEPISGDPKRYLMSSLIEEAITSSQLEGAATTRQVAAEMLRVGRKPRDHSEAMIFNNYRAMEHLQTLKNEPITPDLILDLHRILTEGTLEDPHDAGRFRRADDIHVVDQRDNTIVHEPPSYKELPERLERLCAFANSNETSLPFVHPVLRAILLHFMIGYDHPFVDGNGRTARALFYWSMARSGYWLMEYTSISHILRRSPRIYMRAYLYTETDNNDTTYFLVQQLSTIRRAIVALQEYLTRKVNEQKETVQLVYASPKLRTRFNHRQIALLTHALKQPGEGYRVDAHQRSHNVVNQTARNDLLDLYNLGLLEKAKQGKAFVFFAPQDLRDRISALSK